MNQSFIKVLAAFVLLSPVFISEAVPGLVRIASATHCNTNVSDNPAVSCPQVADVDPLGYGGACLQLTRDLRYQSTDQTTAGEVSKLQDFLNAGGWLSAQPNGFFGTETLAAVKNFQLSVGFSGSGFVGPLTRAKITQITCSSSYSPTTTTTTTSTNQGALQDQIKALELKILIQQTSVNGSAEEIARLRAQIAALQAGGGSQTQTIPPYTTTSVTYPAGCRSFAGFSSTSGLSCALPPGCSSTSGYSVTTGAPCSTTRSPSPTVSIHRSGSLVADASTNRAPQVFVLSCDKQTCKYDIAIFNKGEYSHTVYGQSSPWTLSTTPGAWKVRVLAKDIATGYSSAWKDCGTPNCEFSVTAAALSVPITSSMIVLSPKNGPGGTEDWIVGKTYTIKWFSNGAYRLTLYALPQSSTGTLSSAGIKLAENIQILNNGEGTYSWKVPTSINPGSYRIGFSYYVNGDNKQIESDTFTIKSQSSYPSGCTSTSGWSSTTGQACDGSSTTTTSSSISGVLPQNPSDSSSIYWQPGETRAIRWQATGVDNVNISLQIGSDNGQIIHPIANNIPASKGNYLWKIPASARGWVGTLFVTSSSNKAVYALGANLKVATPYIKVTSQTTTETWQTGTYHVINWEAEGFSNSPIYFYLNQNGSDKFCYLGTTDVGNVGLNAGVGDWGVTLLDECQLPTGGWAPEGFGTAAYRVVATSSQKVIQNSGLVYGNSSGLVYVSGSSYPQPSGQCGYETYGRSCSGNTLYTFTGLRDEECLHQASLKFQTAGSSVKCWVLASNGICYLRDGVFTPHSGTTPDVPIPGGSCPARASDNTTTTTTYTFGVTSPNGGENWQTGNTHDITWQYSGPSDYLINIALVYGDSGAGTIASGIRANLQKYSWTIPSNIAPAPYYRIALRPYSSPNEWLDGSEGEFTISAPTTTTTTTTTTGKVCVTVRDEAYADTNGTLTYRIYNSGNYNIAGGTIDNLTPNGATRCSSPAYYHGDNENNLNLSSATKYELSLSNDNGLLLSKVEVYHGNTAVISKTYGPPEGCVSTDPSDCSGRAQPLTYLTTSSYSQSAYYSQSSYSTQPTSNSCSYVTYGQSCSGSDLYALTGLTATQCHAQANSKFQSGTSSIKCWILAGNGTCYLRDGVFTPRSDTAGNPTPGGSCPGYEASGSIDKPSRLGSIIGIFVRLFGIR